MSSTELPAWSEAFAADRLQPIRALRLATPITREWAWGEGTGNGVRVAVVDSGIDATHPAVGQVHGGVVIEPDDNAVDGIRIVPGEHQDLYGHGTACAAIIRGLAPGCELYSVRVLGPALTGRGRVFGAGLRWAIDNGMDVVNLSLSTRSRANVEAFYELVDEAVIQQRHAGVRGEQCPRAELSVAVRRRLFRRGALGARSGTLCGQSAAAGRVRCAGNRSRSGLVGRGHHHGNGKQLRRPTHCRATRPDRRKHRPITTSEAKTVLRALADNAGS